MIEHDRNKNQMTVRAEGEPSPNNLFGGMFGIPAIDAARRRKSEFSREEQEYSNSLLAVWIGSGTTSVNTVEDQNFKNFLASLNALVRSDL